MRRTLLSLFLACCFCPVALAQQWYDLTDSYLRNADFGTNINHPIDDAVDVRNIVETIYGWQLDAASAKTNTVGATFQYGTKSTFYAIPIPECGPDGEAGVGGCLSLCASLKHELTFYQPVKLPAGNYRLVVTTYNCNPDAESGSSTSGWAADGETFKMSRDVFPVGEWTTDTLDFQLGAFTRGHIQVGFKSAGSRPMSSAMLVVDKVRLLRDTPYNEEDEQALLPTVETDMRFARGATMAFGRIKSIDGEDVAEQGFCWATHPEPVYDDNHTTEHLDNNGFIYWLKDLEPATMYYMRAYAMTGTGKVGYGETIKFSTVPKGKLTYSYNNGGDAAANKRVNDAATNACNIFNDLTSIVKHFNIGYSSGTPTADCYYDDTPWMNMGANASYQRTGTIMHEMQHGLGVIPYTTQWNKNILRESLDGSGRGTGHWLGDRVSAFLDFWDNTTGSRLNGDYQHLWPYGVNGAHEDNGTNELYFANAMIGQALGEDGLEHRYNTFAEPCYLFEQEDDVKYYLTNEAADRGRYTSYLVPNASDKLQWQELSATEAAQNDSAAWYITFTPANQYYQLRNAATGQYLTYSGGFKTMSRTELTSNDNFHLMKGRVNVGSGTTAKRGYWLIHPSGNWEPPCIAANPNGAVISSTFNIANTATRQRWIILTADELPTYDLTGISMPQADETAEVRKNTGIYTLDGRKIHADKSQLKPGLYIINGRKTVIK